MKNIQLLSKIIIKDHIDPISCDGQLNLLLILSQGRPRIVTELLLAKAEKRTNLFQIAMNKVSNSNIKLIDYSLNQGKNQNKYNFEDKIDSITVGEYIVKGVILQPIDFIEISLPKGLPFEPVVSLLSIIKFIKTAPIKEPIYNAVVSKLSNIK